MKKYVLDISNIDLVGIEKYVLDISNIDLVGIEKYYYKIKKAWKLFLVFC